MKAIVYRSYGSPDVLSYEDVEKPVAGPDEVLIRVRAASVNPLDYHSMRGSPYFLRMDAGPRAPKSSRLGVDVAGWVEAAGRNVTEFKPGDDVFGTCDGAFAEYASTSASRLVIKPDNVTFEEAASAPVAALTALQSLRDKGRVRPEQNVLINGAAGGVGTFAVQIARSLGARVTGVCSTRNVEMVRSIGAHHVIDYTQEKFTRNERRYDLILDCVGNHPLSAFRRVLTRKGIFIAIGGTGGPWLGPLPRFIGALALSRFVSQTLIVLLARQKKEDLITIHKLMAAGTIKPVIGRRFKLNEVPSAMRYVEEGHAQGKAVIVVD